MFQKNPSQAQENVGLNFKHTNFYKEMYTEGGWGANVLQPDPARVSALSFIPTLFEGCTK